MPASLAITMLGLGILVQGQVQVSQQKISTNSVFDFRKSSTEKADKVHIT